MNKEDNQEEIKRMAEQNAEWEVTLDIKNYTGSRKFSRFGHRKLDSRTLKLY
jgi:hypothetical protein